MLDRRRTFEKTSGVDRRGSSTRATRWIVPLGLLAIASLTMALTVQGTAPPAEQALGDSSSELVESSSGNTGETIPHEHSDADVHAPSDDHVHEISSIVSDPSHTHNDASVSSGAPPSTESHNHDAVAPGPTLTGPIVSVDDPRLTPTQQNAARTLLTASRTAIGRFPNTASLTLAGYEWSGDNSGGVSHWVKDEFTHDGRELDADRIETFVVNSSTGRTIGVMYLLEPGKTMANVPNIAGELTPWHVHNSICFSTTQVWRFIAVASNGTCPAGSAPRNVPPMMHVWADDPPCGPFVGTEGHGATTCAHSH